MELVMVHSMVAIIVDNMAVVTADTMEVIIADILKDMGKVGVLLKIQKY